MRKRLRVLAMALTCAGAAPVFATAAESPRFDVTPLIGYRAGGSFDRVDPESSAESSVDLDDGLSYGFDVGLYRDDVSFYQLLYTRQESGFESSDAALGSVDLTTEYLQFGGTLLFGEETWYVPWMSLTIGAARFDPSGGGYDSETKLSATLGGGMRLPFNERVAANLGVRGYLTLVDSDTEIFCVGSGDLNCLVRTSGSTFFQGEAFLGLSVSF